MGRGSGALPPESAIVLSLQGPSCVLALRDLEGLSQWELKAGLPRASRVLEAAARV